MAQVLASMANTNGLCGSTMTSMGVVAKSTLSLDKATLLLFAPLKISNLIV